MKKVLDHNCPNCDAVLKFNPEQQNWKCDHCRKEYDLEFLQTVLHNTHNENEQKLEFENIEFDIFVCSNCGAEILCGDNTSVTSCVYCKNTAIIKKRLQGQYKPQYIIPFKVTKEKAKQILDKYKKSKFLIPNDFKNKNIKNELIGVYVPFWLYDYTLDGSIEAMCKKRTFNSVENYKIIRKGSMNFENIPVDGSKKIEDSIMNSIEPFDYNQMIDFNYSYLSGFLSEKYDLCSKHAKKESRDRIQETFIKKMKKSIKKFKKINIENEKFYFRKEKEKYVLLPVWFVNVKYKDEKYFFAINGQTGKIKGRLPVDKKKKFIFSAFIFIICFLFNYFFLIFIDNILISKSLIKTSDNIFFIIVSLIIGFSFYNLTIFKINNNNTIKKAKNADIYKKKGSLKFHKKENIYISTDTKFVEILNDKE